MKPNKYITYTLALMSAGALSLSAHKAWINPSSTILSGDDVWVTFDACISNNLFYANHHAISVDQIKATNPKGEEVELQNSNTGKLKSTFDIQLDEKGTYVIQASRTGLSAMWREDDKRQWWSGTLEEFAKSGNADKKGIRLADNDSKNVTFVTNGEPTKEALKPTGKGLELVFTKSHPNDLVADEAGEFVLHFNGKPAADMEVTVIKGDDRYLDKVTESKVKTNDKGEFTIEWSGAGKYWINVATESDKKEVEGVPYSKKASYTATLEVMQG